MIIVKILEPCFKLSHLLDSKQMYFCEPFAIDISKSSKEPYRHKKEKEFHNKKSKRIEKTSRRKNFKPRKDYKSNKSNACHKCGKISHYARL